MVANPGALVRDVATAMARSRMSWRVRPGVDHEPDSYEIDGETKFIYSAFKKGHLRREQDGTTFRYWPVSS